MFAPITVHRTIIFVVTNISSSEYDSADKGIPSSREPCSLKLKNHIPKIHKILNVVNNIYYKRAKFLVFHGTSK
jgi:hypothetical protein